MLDFDVVSDFRFIIMLFIFLGWFLGVVWIKCECRTCFVWINSSKLRTGYLFLEHLLEIIKEYLFYFRDKWLFVLSSGLLDTLVGFLLPIFKVKLSDIYRFLRGMFR